MTYSIMEVSRKLGISRSAVYRGINNGDIPHVRVGKSVRIPREAFDNWFDCGTSRIVEQVTADAIRTMKASVIKSQIEFLKQELVELEGRALCRH